MTSGNDSTTKRTPHGKKNANCSFCRKSYRDVGPLVEGPDDVYICGECIELCNSILDQERRRRGEPKSLFSKVPTPREMVRNLDQYVIGQDRADSGQDCVVLRPQQMPVPPSRFTRDPGHFTGSGGDLFVGRCRQFQGHHGPPQMEPVDKAAVQLVGPGRERADGDIDTSGLERPDPLTVHSVIGVFDGDDTSGDSGGDQRLGTGGRLAMMAAGFEADIGRGARGPVARLSERFGFGVGPSTRLGPAPADDDAVPDDDAAYRGIGRHAAQSARGKRERHAHPGFIGIAGVSPAAHHRGRQ